jgi:hypothetical protein
MKPIVIALALAASLVACSDPRSTQIPEDLSKMEQLKPVIAKLPKEDQELFANYLVRRTLSGAFAGLVKDAPKLTAKTVGEAIDAQRTFEAETKARQEAEKLALEQRKAKREAAMNAMREAIKVTLANKRIEIERGYSGMEMDRSLRVTFLFANTSDKDIAGIKGRVVVKDLFGDEISAFQISNDSTIKAGTDRTWTGSRSTKFALSSSNKDEKLAELSDDKYTTHWEPQVIVFADGSKVTADD